MSGLDKTFVLGNESAWAWAMGMIESNWRAMAASGHPMAVRIYEHKDQRTLQQQALMWIRLEEIAVQAWVDGRQYADETWHEQMKKEYLPNEEGPTKRCRRGYRKYTILPDGERRLIGSTTQLTTFGMAEYMEKLMAFGASLGVRFAPTPREMREFA